MFQSIIYESTKQKKDLFKQKWPTKKQEIIPCTYKNVVMIDKSTSTDDLIKQKKEQKVLEKFKKQQEEKKKINALFKEHIGSPRNVDEIEDE